MYCGHCGLSLASDAKFCGACGGPVLTAARAPRVDVGQVSPASPAAAALPSSTATLTREKPPREAIPPARARRSPWVALGVVFLALVIAILFMMRRPSPDQPTKMAAPAVTAAAPSSAKTSAGDAAPLSPPARALAVNPTGAAATPEAGCIDISRPEPHSLHGKLVAGIFAGRPNYNDVRMGDDPEPVYILKLRDSICVRSDDADIPADPKVRISEIQVFAQNQDAATSAALRSLLGFDVQVQLSSMNPETTGHDHAPLVAGASSIKIEDGSASDKLVSRVILPETPQGDQSEEAGTAATTVRAFYEALSLGDGEAASAMVVPEKRGSGPYAPDSISRFYGPMPEPLTLTQLTMRAPGEYLVSYQFRLGTRGCHGRAVVVTTVRDGMNLIERIQPLDGC